MDSILKNMNLGVDGRGYAGKVLEITKPTLTVMQEDYRAGGMDSYVGLDMGMEKMEASFVLGSYDTEVLKLWGLSPGNEVPFTIKGALQNEDGTTDQVLIQMRGKINGLDSGTWKPGEVANLTITLNPNYYKETVAGDVVHEIDVKNMVRIVNGVDQLAGIREAIEI